jgi:hypothetical protein
MKSLSIATALLVLAGCSGMMPRTGPGTNEVVMKNAAGAFAPPARGYDRIPMRSFRPDAAGGWIDSPGATCLLRAGAYRARLVTPAVLLMPDLGPDAPVITADCAQGTLRGRDVVAPAYVWPEEGRPSVPSRIAYGGWWFGFQESGPMTYRDIAVGMRIAR